MLSRKSVLKDRIKRRWSWMIFGSRFTRKSSCHLQLQTPQQDMLQNHRKASQALAKCRHLPSNSWNQVHRKQTRTFLGEKCVWIALVESASKRKLKCLELHTFFNTSIAVLMQRETAVAFHVFFSSVCLP